jgi:hypothetical protein
MLWQTPGFRDALFRNFRREVTSRHKHNILIQFNPYRTSHAKCAQIWASDHGGGRVFLHRVA